MVEHRLAKARVAGSNPVSRSKYSVFFSRCLPLPVHHDGDHYSVSLSECFPPQVVQTTDLIDVTFASVEEAVRILRGVAHYTPVLTSCQLDALSGARVFLKCENFQRVGVVLTGGNVEWLRPWPRLAGCGKAISARENFDGPHVWPNRSTLP